MTDWPRQPLGRKHDETFVIAASGPSLSDSQVEYIEKAHAEGRCKVIAVNDNYKRLPFADYFYAADEAWWDVHHAAVAAIGKGEMWTAHPRAAAKYGVKLIAGKNGRGLSLLIGTINTGGNSGYAAIGLAFQLFAARILLVGFDFQRTGGKAHWFGEHPKPLSRTHPYRSWLERIEQLAQDLRACGLDILNCTITTAIPEKAIRRSTIEEEL